MPGSFASGFSAPSEGGPLFFPESEQAIDIPLPPDEDFFLPSILPNVAIVSLLLAASSLSAIGNSTTEEWPIPTAYEEDSWIPPVLVESSHISLLVGGSSSIPSTASIVDEDYQHKAPTVWPIVQVRLSWDANDSDIAIVSGDEGELLPRVPVVGITAKLLNWDQDEVAVITVDESEYLSPLTHIQWQSSVVTDPSGDYTLAPAVMVDEDLWFPPVYQPTTSLQLLVGTSAPSAPVVTALIDEVEWIPLSKFVSLWCPRIVSEPSSEIVPFVAPGPVYEDDYWLPPVLPITTSVQLLSSATGPAVAT